MKRKQSKNKFTIKSSIDAKFNFLHSKIYRLSFNEITWLNRLESYWLMNQFMSEKQFNVLNQIVKRHDLNFKQLSLFA